MNIDCAIIHGNVITPSRIIEQGCVLIADGKIVDVLDTIPRLGETVDIIDAKGNYVPPASLICIRMAQAVPILWTAIRRLILQ
nr:hypothetical protein [Segatella maculosa]